MASIGLDASSDLRYQGVARFVTDAGKLKGNAWPMVLISAYGDDDALIYAELVKPDAAGVATVTLGGGGSIWVYERPNTPAHCAAALYSYSKQGTITLLAGPIAFEAAG